MNRGAWQSRTLLSDFSLHFTHGSQRPGPESEPHSPLRWEGADTLSTYLSPLLGGFRFNSLRPSGEVGLRIFRTLL